MILADLLTIVSCDKIRRIVMFVDTAGNDSVGFVNYCNMYKIHIIVHVCEYCRK